ncbi:unnamed protein product [Phaeothamnion confervicola]
MKNGAEQPPREKSFRELIGKVRPLVYDTIEPERARTPPRRRRVEPEASSVALEPAAAQRLGSDSHDAAAGHDYHRPGLQNSVLRKLRRGQFPVQDELDLHGMTVREAGVRLGDFLVHARGRRLSCIRIIHGKGLSSPGRSPVLKPQVARWLRAHEGVLAFAPARSEDGGSGALYVLLRSRRD